MSLKPEGNSQGKLTGSVSTDDKGNTSATVTVEITWPSTG